MNKSRIYLYVVYVLLVETIIALASCASEDVAASCEQKDGRLSLNVNVMQITEGTKTRTAAPAIKNYQMETTGSKPVYAQFSSEAFIDKHCYEDKHGRTAPSFAESRGVSVASDTFFERFGLFCYQYGKEESWANIVAANTQSPTINNMAVEKSAGWLTDKYWPGADHKLTFMAYAPYDNDYKNGSTKYIQLASNIKGYPTLTYTVPAKVEDQQDLVVSAEDATQDMDGDYNKVVGMKFYHTLSAINFKIGSTMAPGRIAKIAVKGIRNKGVYNFGSRTWTNLSGTANYTITPNYIITDQRGVVFTGVDDSKNDLLQVIPQTVPAGAKLVVTIEDGANYSSSHDMELSLEGHEWLPGYTITYSLSTAQENSDYILSIVKINTIDKNSTELNYKVSSYTQSYYGSQTPVGWTAEYAIDDDISADNYSSAYGDVVKGGFQFDMESPTSTTSSLTASIAALEPPVSNPDYNTHTATLRAAAPLGNLSNPYDLSTQGGTQKQSTANCYIVKAPGWYKIPMVYGNCIKNGSNNSAVFGSGKNTFVNHLNKVITMPYLINNSGVVPVEAIVAWQDAYKMIAPDSVMMSSDKKYILFKVNQDKICQGNALLAVRDGNNKILWSWHIWVTDEDISSATNIPITNLKNSVYNLMKQPLGYCEKDRRSYKPREISFRIKQNGSGNTAETRFKQTTTSYQEYGLTAPFYEYGRSVPLRIANGLANESKTLFLADGVTYETLNKRVTTGEAIQHPLALYWIDGGDWNTTVYNNLWDAVNIAKALYDRSNHVSVKTIYDPCPVGYKVPEPEAFTGFTKDGLLQTSSANYNVSGSFNKGWNFYTKPNKQGATVFFGAWGYINWQGEFTEINTGKYCYYITSGPYNYSGYETKIELCVSFEQIIPHEGRNRRCASRMIRAVADD